jgi:hypothetical protein
MGNTRKPKKLCPKCGLEGSGPYKRWVLNSRKTRYEPYYYFAHKHGKGIGWCYLGRLSNKSEEDHRCVDCANLTEDNFCVWQQAYIKKRELLTQPFKCEGFQPKRQELSNKGETTWLRGERLASTKRNLGQKSRLQNRWEVGWSPSPIRRHQPPKQEGSS